jgi:hypothetical protein
MKLPKGKFMKGLSSQYQIAMEKSIIKRLNKLPKLIPMKVAIIGSRTFDNKNRLFIEMKLFRQVLTSFKKPDITEIVSGGAQGADKLAEEYANEMKLKLKVFKADWTDFAEPCRIKTGPQGEYNALAGFNRNTKIIEYCDQVIAFWDGKSPGTKDSLDKSVKLGKKVNIIIIK